MPAASVLHILRTIKERVAISRTDLQQITHLSWGTITNTTRELLQRNLIREEGSVSTKAGRKPVQLAINPAGHSLIGIEIAPDLVRCLTMNLAGETLEYSEAPSQANEPAEEVLNRIVTLVIQAISATPERACLGVGVAVPGSLDLNRGIVRHAPQLPGWRDVELLPFLQDRLNTVVRMEHKPSCLALAERWFGDAVHADNLLCIHLGETVGLGILVEGEVFRGSQHLAGEFGHVTIDPDGPPCTCGDHGCVEAYCSAAAMVAHIQTVAAGDPAASKVRTIEELAALAESGNSAALGTFERMGRHLGIGVANLIDLFNPDLIVFAGRLTMGKEHFVPKLMEEVEKHAGRQSRRELMVSRLGERATTMGACGMILQSSLASNDQAAAPRNAVGLRA